MERILCVFSTLDRGGSESMCMNLYRNIDRNKIQFDFVKHSSSKGAYEDEIISLGGKIYTAPRYKIRNHFSYCKWWKNHFRNHPEHKIVHGHFFTFSAVFFSVARKFNVSTVSHIHAISVSNKIKEKYIDSINKYADYKFACSEESGKLFYHDENFTVLNNAVDSELFEYNSEKREHIRKNLNLENSFVLGTVANLSPIKNPFGLIDIYIQVLKREPTAKLLWVGEGGLREEIEEKIKSENLTDKVILLGRRNDVADLLQAMDAFLLPSFSEGLPVSIIEAQASGLPCFISDKVTRESDVTGRCTYLPLNNYSLWADKIVENKYDRINTRNLIIENGYDIHTTAKWLEDFYLKIIDEK